MDWNLLSYINNDTTAYTNEEIIEIVKRIDSENRIHLHGCLSGVVTNCCKNLDVSVDYERYKVDDIKLFVMQCRECRKYIISAKYIKVAV